MRKSGGTKDEERIEMKGRRKQKEERKRREVNKNRKKK